MIEVDAQSHLLRRQQCLKAVTDAQMTIGDAAHLLSVVHWRYTAAGAATVGCMCPGVGIESPAQRLPWALHRVQKLVAFSAFTCPMPACNIDTLNPDLTQR